MAATDPIRDKKHLRELAGYWLKRGKLRNYTMIVLGVCTVLRISDLLRLTWADVYDEDSGEFRTHIHVTEQKTGKQRTIALHAKAIGALRLYYPSRRGAFLFANNRKNKRPISRVQAWRIIREAVKSVRLTGRIGCHSLRKSFGYFAWQDGVPPVMLMDIYNHTSFNVTRCYLGIAQDDRDKVYLSMALF